MLGKKVAHVEDEQQQWDTRSNFELNGSWYETNQLHLHDGRGELDAVDGYGYFLQNSSNLSSVGSRCWWTYPEHETHSHPWWRRNEIGLQERGMIKRRYGLFDDKVRTDYQDEREITKIINLQLYSGIRKEDVPPGNSIPLIDGTRSMKRRWSKVAMWIEKDLLTTTRDDVSTLTSSSVSRRGLLLDAALNEFRVETGDRRHFFRFSCPTSSRSRKGLTDLTTVWRVEWYAYNKSRPCRIADQCTQGMHGFQFWKTGVMTRRTRIKGETSDILSGWPDDLY